MDSNFKVQIPTLQGSKNYQAWVLKIQAHMMYHGFWTVYLGEQVMKEETTVSSTTTTIEDVVNDKENAKQEMKAKGLIMMTVSKVITIEIANLSTETELTAKDIWKPLERSTNPRLVSPP
jgi:prophage antirepressor-like protein